MISPLSRFAAWNGLAMLAFMGGCGYDLPASPTVHTQRGEAIYAAVPEARRSSRVSVLYATDRQRTEGAEQPYGYGRSRALAWGVCEVDIGETLAWDDLVALTTDEKRREDVPVRVADTRELGHFEALPLARAWQGGQLLTAPEAVAAQDAAVSAFTDYVRACLAHTEVKDVYIAIHGVDTDFEMAAIHGAELWHYLGHQGVVVAYSWPAGHPGLLEGYTYDFTSSRFTVTHFNQLMQALGQIEEVQRIHLVAHSRGNEVLLSGLRELVLQGEIRAMEARGVDLGHLVLVAADLDLSVVLQRASANHVFAEAESVTIYVSDHDAALGLSKWLWRSMQRLGMTRYDDLSEDARALLQQARTVHFVDVQMHWGRMGHSYYQVTVHSFPRSHSTRCSACALGGLRLQQVAWLRPLPEKTFRS